MLYKILFYLLVTISIIYAYIKYMEARGIFYPEKQVRFTPKNINAGFDDVYLTTEDNITLNGWFIPYNEAKYTLIFLHGNAGNIGNRLDKINLLRETKCNIFIIDYRGYGHSKGAPCEIGFYYDARAAYKYLLIEHGISPDQIILYGESLGAAVATDLAAKSEVKAVILEGAFSCAKDMAKIIFPFLPGFIFQNKFDSLKKIASVKAAKLFIHADNDEIVPINLGKKLFNSAPEPKVFTELSGSHNEAFLSSKDKYITAIKSFINNMQ